jgi:hypothetical protein
MRHLSDAVRTEAVISKLAEAWADDAGLLVQRLGETSIRALLAVAAPLQAGLLTKKRLHQGTGLVLVNINRQSSRPLIAPPDLVSKPY